MLMKAVQLKNKQLQKPIIQGGMGIGVSRCHLAGAVAKEGGMGVISSAQVGYDEPDFRPVSRNMRKDTMSPLHLSFPAGRLPMLF